MISFMKTHNIFLIMVYCCHILFFTAYSSIYKLLKYIYDMFMIQNYQNHHFITNSFDIFLFYISNKHKNASTKPSPLLYLIFYVKIITLLLFTSK